jgi:hypothetical protein
MNSPQGSLSARSKEFFNKICHQQTLGRGLHAHAIEEQGQHAHPILALLVITLGQRRCMELFDKAV